MHYTFILKNEKLKNYRAISQLLVFFNLLGFIFLLLSSKEKMIANLLLLISVVIAAGYTLIAINNSLSKKATPVRWHRIIFLFCSLVWIIEEYWWLSMALAFFILFDILAHKKVEVKISGNKIILPSLIKKEVAWNELNNLILKDDLLTIDFKNNKLFQHLILNKDKDVNEKEFNEFCKSSLTNDY